MVQSLIISRKVSSTVCALHFPGDTDIGSKIRRVERFYERSYLSTETAIDFLLKFKSSDKVHNPLQLYRKRWEIECFFKKLKTAGFNLESTNLKDSNRLKSLILLCAMAHLVCTLLGIFRHNNIRAIKFKRTLNCYQFSFFRYGLD